MKDKNSSNNYELSVRERIELERELRRITVEIRKEHSSDWREILKSTDVYKKLHNISDSENQNEETNVASKQIKNTYSKNKNKSYKDIKKSNTPKNDIKSNKSDDIKKSDVHKKVILKENVEIKNKDNLEVVSTKKDIKELDNIKNDLKNNSALMNDFFSEINNDGFLSYEKRENIIAKYSLIYKTISKLNKFPDSHKQKIFLEFENLERLLKIYEDLINYTNLSDTSKYNEIRKINEKALDAEIDDNEDFFKDIDDIYKKRAIVIDEKNVRVNAGAGTGKTFTIQNKAKYLIERRGVPPEKILCLCYTVKGAADLDDKVNQNLDNDNEVKACTFHEFCRSVARDCKCRKTTDRTILETAILNYTRNLDDNKLNKLIEYFGYYINPPVEEDYSTYEELLAYENGKDLKTLKTKFYGSSVSTLTMQGEIVKSIGELMIANYLFMHEIEYKYETNYESVILNILENKFIYSGIYFSLSLESKELWVNNLIAELEQWRSYHPDFYLPEYDIYLEHFGIAKNNDENWLGEDYIDQMNRKRQFHKSNNTKLLETYYYYLAEGRLIEELEKLLLNNGIEIGQMDRNDILEILKDANRIEDFENFIELVKSFINIFEAQNKQKNQFDVFKKQNNSVADGYRRKRQELFLDIVGEIYNIYYRKNNGRKIDNNREVSLALELIQTKKYSASFDYIFIDEYQDINPIRSLLLSSLQEVTDAKLFVVGDDWQSIYRFNGSDMNLFIDFDNDFPNSELIKLEENRRNYDDLNDIASNFIMENKKQEKKKLVSKKIWKSGETPIKIVYYSPKPVRKKVLQLYEILNQISKDNQSSENIEILLLGRNNKDIEEFTGNNLFKLDNRLDHVKIICLEKPELDIKFMSIHKSKGLEYDEVIILNFKDYFSGFPNKIEDDSVLRFIKEKEEYLYAEERRLLYVALTRTKNNVYLLSPNYDKSIFIKELEENYDINSIEYDVDERIEENFAIIEKTPEQLENFNKKLNEANVLKNRRKNGNALKLFEECYKIYPENFKYSDKENYAWTIYKTHVNNVRNEKDFFKSVNFIINLVEQKNSSKLDISCVYTSTIFKALKYLASNGRYDEMFLWFDKIDLKLLNPFSYEENGKIKKSKKELFYDYLTNAYYSTGQYEKCIEISNVVLNNSNDSVDDSWVRWRLGKSLNRLGKTREAVEYLAEAAKVIQKWDKYIYVVKCYNRLGDYLNALKYACPVILCDVSPNVKIEIYRVLFDTFRNRMDEQAIKHGQFYYLLKKGRRVPQSILEIIDDESKLDYHKLNLEITEIWQIYDKGQKEHLKAS